MLTATAHQDRTSSECRRAESAWTLTHFISSENFFPNGFDEAGIAKRRLSSTLDRLEEEEVLTRGMTALVLFLLADLTDDQANEAERFSQRLAALFSRSTDSSKNGFFVPCLDELSFEEVDEAVSFLKAGGEYVNPHTIQTFFAPV